MLFFSNDRCIRRFWIQYLVRRSICFHKVIASFRKIAYQNFTLAVRGPLTDAVLFDPGILCRIRRFPVHTIQGKFCTLQGLSSAVCFLKLHASQNPYIAYRQTVASRSGNIQIVGIGGICLYIGSLHIGNHSFRAHRERNIRSAQITIGPLRFAKPVSMSLNELCRQSPGTVPVCVTDAFRHRKYSHRKILRRIRYIHKGQFQFFKG